MGDNFLLTASLSDSAPGLHINAPSTSLLAGVALRSERMHL